MTVGEFIKEVEKLQSKTCYNLHEWEMCIIVNTLDDKYVTAYSIDYDGTDAEGNFYFKPEERVYKKETE